MNGKFLRTWVNQPDIRRLIVLTAVFLSVMLLVCLNRYYTFYASYDHGLFNQVFWNNLHGRWFQSSLTGANSIGVTADGKIPPVTFAHLAHHFIPDFLLWLPLYALFPSPVTLVVLQVGLITAAGVVLYALARHYLLPNLALMITAGYYCASAVIGPTFANFYEQCQLPLFSFSLLLAMEKQRWWLFWLLAVLVLGVREDAGFVLFSIGLYLLLSRRHPRIGVGLCVLSFAYVVAVTNLIIPRFSDDAQRLYFAVRFRQFVRGDANPTTLQVLWGMMTHPIELIQSLLTPFDRRAFYLFRHWLPLAFVPAVSGTAWVVSGVPLLALMVQTGQTALSITVRYALAVVPGVFYGAIVWWSYNAKRFTPKFRRLWVSCMALSIVFAISANPNRTLYFLIPDSFVPWVHVSLTRQWQHSSAAQQVIRTVPPDASVSATTYLIPPLSSRRAIIRLPLLQFKDDRGEVRTVDYLAADLWQLQQYQVAFKEERDTLRRLVPLIEQTIADSSYGLRAVQDGVVLLQKGVASDATALANWTQYRKELGAIVDRVS